MIFQPLYSSDSPVALGWVCKFEDAKSKTGYCGFVGKTRRGILLHLKRVHGWSAQRLIEWPGIEEYERQKQGAIRKDSDPF